MVFQVQLAHDQTALPLTRDYIGELERAMARPKTASAERENSPRSSG